MEVSRGFILKRTFIYILGRILILIIDVPMLVLSLFIPSILGKIVMLGPAIYVFIGITRELYRILRDILINNVIYTKGVFEESLYNKSGEEIFQHSYLINIKSVGSRLMCSQQKLKCESGMGVEICYLRKSMVIIYCKPL